MTTFNTQFPIPKTHTSSALRVGSWKVGVDRLCATCALLALAALFSTAPFAAVQDPVRTDAGQLSGVTLPSGVRAFKGIPFGAPPTGELRWKPAQPVAKWEGVRKAETFGNVCTQPKGRGRLNVSVDLPDSPQASEDCLYLNVWTP